MIPMENTLSSRLKIALKSKHLNQSELARQINVKPQTIQYLCQKNIQSSKFTYKIAESLGINYIWLATGEGQMDSTDSKNEDKYFKAPLLGWEKLSDYFAHNNVNTEQKNYLLTTAPTTSFAVILNDNSMEPRFEKGTTLIIDSQGKPRNHDFVLVKIYEHNTYLFRQLKIDSTKQILRPINSDLYKEIILKKDDIIYGTLVQTICNYTNN